MANDREQSVWEHLDELIRRLRRAFAALIITTIALLSIPRDLHDLFSLNLKGYQPLISVIMEYIQESLLPEGVNLIAFNWLDTIYIYFLVAFIIGFVITLPILAFEIYKFVDPALYSNEKKNIIIFVLAITILFSIGVAYAWFILLPNTFRILYQFVYQSRILPFFSVKDFYNMIAFGLVGSGIFYTFPVIIWFLVRADLLETNTLKNNRRQLFVGLIIVTAIFTPDPTPLTMLLMSVPFYILYELTIQILDKTMPKGDEKIIASGLKASMKLLEREKVQS